MARPPGLRETVLLKRLADVHPALLVAATLAAVVAAVVLLARALDLAPPDRLTMAAGRAGGGYHAVAERYRAALADDGITLEILETAGSVENVRRLADGDADVALLQGGIAVPPGTPAVALAAVFLEPFFLFYRSDVADATDPARWSSLRVAAGEPGSGTRAAVLSAIHSLDLDIASEDLAALGGRAAAEALRAGELDAAVFVAPVDAPYLEALLVEPGIAIAPIRDAEALARRLAHVRLVDIPRAAIDYRRRIPERPVPLVAMVATLAARADLHPALVNRLVRAAQGIHAGPTLVSESARFPSTEGVGLPLDVQASRLLQGPPGPLERLLPYWISAQISRVLLVLVPLLVLLLPVLRTLPALYRWRMEARVYNRYDELVEIDREASRPLSTERRAALLSRLSAIEVEARSLRVPARYREKAYALRLHIDLVRQKLKDARTAEATEGEGSGGR